MKPLVTMIREALVERLKESPELALFVGGTKADPDDRFFNGGRIYLNRSEAWDERELTTIGLYVLSEEPIEPDVSNEPSERRLTFAVEILSRDDPSLEERLDLIAAWVEVYYTLPALGELIRAKGGPDTLLEIKWLGNERGFIPEAELTLGANVMTFALDYRRPWEELDLPPFETAGTDWKARTPEGKIGAENIVHLDQD